MLSVLAARIIAVDGAQFAAVHHKEISVCKQNSSKPLCI
jgi:hypothetical protein